jgi:hypothetical protein
VTVGDLWDGLRSGLLPVLAALGLMAVGGLSARLMGIRDRIALLTLAPLLTFGLLLLSAQAGGLLGLRWSPAVVLPGALLLPLASAMLRRFWTTCTPSQDQGQGQHGKSLLLFPIVGSLLGAVVWIMAIRDFAVPGQHIDDIFHGYATARMANMSAVTTTTVVPVSATSAEPSPFYPYGLHLAAALVHATTHLGVVPILNAMWVVFAGLLPPVGTFALARALMPGRPLVASISSVLAPTMTLFPYMLDGIQPYAIATCMVPGFLAMFVCYLKGNARTVWGAAVLAVSSAGLIGTHPAAAATAAVLAALLGIEAILRTTAGRPGVLGRALLAATMSAAMSLPWFLGLGGVSSVESYPSGTVAKPVGSIADTLGTLAGLGSPWTVAQPLMALLTLFGLIICVAKLRCVGLWAGWLMFAILFVGAASGVEAAVRITWPWYAEWYRLLAVVGMLTPILVATAVAWAATNLLRPVTPGGFQWARGGAAGAAIAVVLVAVIAGVNGLRASVHYVNRDWHARAMVGADDIRVFAALQRTTGPDQLVLNNPRDGSTWMYAMSDVNPALPYATAEAARPAIVRAWQDIGSIETSPQVCRTLLMRSVTAVFTKPVDIYGEPEPAYERIRSEPGLFRPLLVTKTSAAYSIDLQSLRACASGLEPMRTAAKSRW